MARKPDSHHVLPLFCDDLIASCVDMTPACFGAYMRLLCYAWTRGGIPDDEGACSRITGGIKPGDWAALRSRLVTMEDGRLTHQRLELERVAVADMRERKSEAGKKGNAARWGSQSDRTAIANASQAHRKTIAPNPSPSLPTKDIQTPSESVATSEPPKRRKRSQHHEPVRWTLDGGWEGITDADRKTWAEAYPACLVDIELLRASEWLRGNPTKAKKSNWRRFLVAWLTRSQDKGGTIRTPGNRPDEKPPPQSWKDQYQQAPYRRPREVAALAAGIKLKDEDA